MREDWITKTLGEIGEFTRGGNFTKSDFVEIGIPCIHYGQIHMHYGVTTEKTLSYLPKDFQKIKYAKKGDLIIAITSEDDEGSCKCTAWLGNENVAVGGHIAVYHHSLDPKFMSYYFRSPQFQKEKLAFTHGFKVVEIKPSDIAKIRISYPKSLSEQERIVSLLDEQFAKIDALKANAASQLQAAKDLFQTALKQLLTPQKGWEEKKLGEVSTIIGGSTPKTNDSSNWGGNNNWVTPAELNGEKYYGKTKRTISDKAAKGMQLLPIGTVLLSSRAPIGKVAITTEPMYCNQGFKNIVCSNVLYNEYVYWYILFSVPQLEALGVGATFKELSKSTTEEFPISFPSLPEQERIAARLDTISEKVKALQANYDQTINLCNDLKQSLLKSIFA